MIALPGGLWVLDADEIVLVAQLALAGHGPLTARWRGDGIPLPPELEGMAVELRARLDERRRQAPSRRELERAVATATGTAGTGETSQVPRGSAQVPPVVRTAVVPGSSSWPDTRSAARTLGCSVRGVTKAITEGRLRAVRDRRGHWRVDPAELATDNEPETSAREPRDDAVA